jgi:hypothetical protein
MSLTEGASVVCTEAVGTEDDLLCGLHGCVRWSIYRRHGDRSSGVGRMETRSGMDGMQDNERVKHGRAYDRVEVFERPLVSPPLENQFVPARPFDFYRATQQSVNFDVFAAPRKQLAPETSGLA